MREQLERLATEALEQVSALNTELDACAADDIGHERELEQAFRQAATALVDSKRALKQELQLKCAEIIADITKLQMAMPDVAGPRMSELEPPFKPLLERLESQTQQFRFVAAARTQRRESAMATIRDVCMHMDLSVPEFNDSLSESDVCDLEAKASAYRARQTEREAELSRITREVNDMCAFLAEDAPSLSEELHEGALRAALDVHASIRQRYEERKAELSRIETQVTQLAELLEVSSELGSSGNAADRLKAADARLAELNDLKRQCIAQVVDKARVKITQAWDALCVDARHRASVPAMLSPDASETVLQALEAERLALQALEQDTDRQHIVKLLREYSELRALEQQLAEASRDPKRLAQRGFSQILKREEATRKLVERKKPPLVQALLPLLEEWTRTHHGDSFALDGEPVSDIIEQERMKLERRSRTSLPRKRPTSSNSQQAAETTAKRVRTSLSIPLLRPADARNAGARSAGAPSSSSAATRRAPPVPLVRSSAARHARMGAAAPQASKASVSAQASARQAGPVASARARPAPSQHNTPEASSRSAAMHAAAIRAASSAVRSEREQRTGPASQAPAASRPRSMVVASHSAAHLTRANPTMPVSVDARSRAPASRPPSSRPSSQPQARQDRRPAIQSTPVGVPQRAAPQWPVLMPQRAAALNRQAGRQQASKPSTTSPLSTLGPLSSLSPLSRPSRPSQPSQPLDWRAQRKADLQENGLSYYDDSTAEVSVVPPGAPAPAPAPGAPSEESFNFKHFF